MAVRLYRSGWGISASWKGFYPDETTSSSLFDKHLLSLDKQRFENDYYVRDRNGNFNGSRRLFDYWKSQAIEPSSPS